MSEWGGEEALRCPESGFFLLLTCFQNQGFSRLCYLFCHPLHTDTQSSLPEKLTSGRSCCTRKFRWREGVKFA